MNPWVAGLGIYQYDYKAYMNRTNVPIVVCYVLDKGTVHAHGLEIYCE